MKSITVLVREVAERGGGSAIFTTFLIASMMLPVALYGPHVDDSGYFLEVGRNALPEGTPLNRAVVASLLVAAQLGFMLLLQWRRTPADRRGRTAQWEGSSRRWLSDLPMAAWIATPVLVGLGNDSSFVSDVWQSLYLMVVWGVPYGLGRLLFTHHRQLTATLHTVMWVGAAWFAAALSEFFFGRFVYQWFIGTHPFQEDGPIRFVGTRPLLAFEDPNQIAMWWATLALSAVALIALARQRGCLELWRCWALLPVAIFQSFGGLSLSLAGGFLILHRNRRWLAYAITAICVIGLVGVSLRGPLLKWGRDFSHSSPIGQQIHEIVRHTSIGSLGWRFGLEEDNVALLRLRPWLGWGQVTFWKKAESGVRPWGLMTLVTGAYGLVGLSVWMSLWLPPLWAWWSDRTGSSEKLLIRKALVVILLCHVIDAALNSAFFLPIVMWLGGLNRLNRTG